MRSHSEILLFHNLDIDDIIHTVFCALSQSCQIVRFCFYIYMYALHIYTCYYFIGLCVYELNP